MQRRVIDYGLDAPYAYYGLGASVCCSLLLGVVFGWWVSPYILLLGVVGALASVVAIVWMRWSSRVGKVRLADAIVEGLQLAGEETVLDVGCGHGLYLVKMAEQLPRGKAVGLDCWRELDQKENTPEATAENVRLAGVEERVTLVTGDAREIPYPEGHFDVVVAHLVVHNLPSRAGREAVMREMVRVLKPGGQLRLIDFLYIKFPLGEKTLNWSVFPPVTITAYTKRY